MQKRRTGVKGFTLIESMTVLCIMALLVGLTVPAIRGMSGANQLSNAARLVSNLLSVARTEAITKQTPTRFVVVENWAEQPHAEGRRMSIWIKKPATTEWAQLTKWEDIPQGVHFDDAASSYVGDFESDHFMAKDGSNSFSVTVNAQEVELRYLEFMPTGVATAIPSMNGMDIWMALSAENQSSGKANWAKITASTLTGRLKIDRP